MNALLALPLMAITTGLAAQQPLLSCCVPRLAGTSYTRPATLLESGPDSLRFGGVWTDAGGRRLLGHIEVRGDTLSLVITPAHPGPDSVGPAQPVAWEAVISPLPRRSFIFEVMGAVGERRFRLAELVINRT